MLMRVYIHAPDLPNSRRSGTHIESRLRSSGLSADIIVNKADPLVYEYTTLYRMWEESKKEDFYALYLHLKGSSKVNSQEFENARCWMDYMLYGVADNWSICRKHLDDGADLVGSQWHWHFKGNFWWAKSSYLRSLPNPMHLSSDRFAAEYWCCWGLWRSGFPKPAIRNLFYVDGMIEDGLYRKARYVAYPPDLSRKTIFVDQNLDAIHGETIDCFLDRKYYCAFDRIYIPNSKIHLLIRLADFLNYDGQIFIGDNLYDTIEKPRRDLF